MNLVSYADVKYKLSTINIEENKESNNNKHDRDMFDMSLDMIERSGAVWIHLDSIVNPLEVLSKEETAGTLRHFVTVYLHCHHSIIAHCQGIVTFEIRNIGEINNVVINRFGSRTDRYLSRMTSCQISIFDFDFLTDKVLSNV